jgi:hypothetical protein
MSFFLKKYFTRPFPKTQGFAAYRNPGPVVHYPIILVSLSIGYYLCQGNIWLQPLLLIYLVAGIYLGRDWAIAAHYNLFLTIFVWIVTAGLWVFYPQIPTFAKLTAEWDLGRFLLPILVSAGVLIFFGWHIWRQMQLLSTESSEVQKHK